MLLIQAQIWFPIPVLFFIRSYRLRVLEIDSSNRSLNLIQILFYTLFQKASPYKFTRLQIFTVHFVPKDPVVSGICFLKYIRLITHSRVFSSDPF
jgi:hypothetical protein